MPPKPCPEGKVRNPKTNRCIKEKKEEWNQQIEKQFLRILDELRKPKLAGVFSPNSKAPPDCTKCIRQARTQQLQTQLNSRKQDVKPAVNILIPRKKKKLPTLP